MSRFVLLRGNGFFPSLVQMENQGSDEVEKLKTKFMSVWNNVKYSKFLAFRIKTFIATVPTAHAQSFC